MLDYLNHDAQYPDRVLAKRIVRPQNGNTLVAKRNYRGENPFSYYSELSVVTYDQKVSI